jgi:hypothetical protein
MEMAERVRDSGRWARLGSEFGVSEFKRYEEYGGVRLLIFHGRSGGNNEAGWRGKEDGVRPEEGVEPGRDPGVEHMKGENGIWKSARDIIPMVVLSPTSDVVISIRLAQPVTPSSTPPSSSLPCSLHSVPLDYY